MKKLIKRILLIMFAVSVVFGVSLVYAYYEDSVSVTNHIAMGDINIGITEYEMKNGREVLYEGEKLVFPGDVISKIPRITNYAKECWIRVKLSYFNNMEEVEGISSENISGMTEDWVLRGDYYYYQKVLDSNASVDVFQKLIIPEKWSEEHSSQKLSLQIEAEAIQAANFTPDFTAMSPWGNQEIELCVHEENGVLSCVKEPMSLYVEFNGKAHKLLAVPSNFFHNIKRAMPGDVYEDEIALLNTTECDAELFFRTEVMEQSEEQMELLKKIQLQIRMNQQILYDGNLLSKELENSISLGDYAPGSEGSLNFRIEIPAELNNAYALREADVKWIFSVKEDEENVDNQAGSDDSSVSKDAVKTGDDSPVLFMLILALVSAGAVFGWFISKRKGSEPHEK